MRIVRAFVALALVVAGLAAFAPPAVAHADRFVYADQIEPGFR